MFLFPTLMMMVVVAFLMMLAVRAVITRMATTTIAPASFNKNHQHHHVVYVNFDNVTIISKTTATLQVVSNPVLSKEYSPIASTLYDNLALLQADLVRYAAWYPYPTIGVAELEPPNVDTQTTSWKFGEELQQQFLDVWHAVVGQGGSGRLVITFSTQPAWMFNTSNWSYSNDTRRSDWHYDNGAWMPSTTKRVADYYARLASWMVLGEFQDEFGNPIRGGPELGLGNDGTGGGVTHWEVFNEPEAEHHLSPQQYNLMYDAIVRSIRNAVDPDHTIEFFGMALSGHHEWNWWNTFLDPSNHASDVRDALANGYASFHFYASPSSRTNVSTYPEVWAQVEDFVQEVDQILALRDQLSPTTKLAVNEAGVIPRQDNAKGVPDLPPIYFNMVAAMYTGLLLQLSIRGVDIVGSSQFSGCPEMPLWNIPDRQFPGVSMTNWTTGSGNPRYWALKLINERLGPGDAIVYTSVLPPKDSQLETPDVIVQGRLTAQGRKILVLVNKTYQRKLVSLPLQTWEGREDDGDDHRTTTYHVSVVDEKTHDGPWREHTTQQPTLLLNAFAVVVVQVMDGKQADTKNQRIGNILTK
jgi:hypothetical protein